MLKIYINATMCTGIFWTLLILETVLLVATENTCENMHLQEIHCRSTKVFKVDIISENNGTYAMNIREYYKGWLTGLMPDDPAIIDVKTNISLDNVTAVIFGRAENGTFVMDNCTGVVPWNNLTSFQQKSVFNGYGHGCDCVSQMPEYEPSMICRWQFSYMYNRNGMCIFLENPALQACNESIYAQIEQIAQIAKIAQIAQISQLIQGGRISLPINNSFSINY